MLPYLHTVVLAVHVLFAAAWFGLSLSLPSLSRAAQKAGAAEGGPVMASMNGSIVLFYLAAVANWVLGRRLGFEAQYDHWAYHTSLTLGLILVAVHFLLIRPGWNRLVRGAGTPAAESGRKRLSMGLGIGHLVWLTIFVLMYLGRGVLGG